MLIRAANQQRTSLSASRVLIDRSESLCLSRSQRANNILPFCAGARASIPIQSKAAAVYFNRRCRRASGSRENGYNGRNLTRFEPSVDYSFFFPSFFLLSLSLSISRIFGKTRKEGSTRISKLFVFEQRFLFCFGGKYIYMYIFCIVCIAFKLDTGIFFVFRQTRFFRSTFLKSGKVVFEKRERGRGRKRRILLSFSLFSRIERVRLCIKYSSNET